MRPSDGLRRLSLVLIAGCLFHMMGCTAKPASDTATDSVVSSVPSSDLVLDPDSDGDRLTDSVEVIYGTDPNLNDTDDDGLGDYVEIALLHTDPLMADSDQNGILDRDEDHDSDGLSSGKELSIGTNPALVDTDGDEVTDEREVTVCSTDPISPDTDGDGLFDGKEMEFHTDPLVVESDVTLQIVADSVATLSMQTSATTAQTLRWSRVYDSFGLPSSMPGYGSGGYELRTSGTFSSATVTFDLDGFSGQPGIYRYDRQAFGLQLVPTVVKGTVATAVIEEQGIYLLLDQRRFFTAFPVINVATVDTDGDGIPDDYEEVMVWFNGIKVGSDRSKTDTDGDGVPDGQELTYVTQTVSANQVRIWAVPVKGDPTRVDTDGDGTEDAGDKAPFDWDVSQRDLAILCQALYYDKLPTDVPLDRLGDGVIRQVDEDFYGTASIAEMADWQLEYRFCSNGDAEKDRKYGGFCYGIFSNATNSVLVFRGSVGNQAASVATSRGDWYSNFFIYPFMDDPDGGLAEQTVQNLLRQGYADGRVFSITGHSRGGMLAQRAGVGLARNKQVDRVKQIVYFNGMGVVFTLLGQETKETYDQLKAVQDKVMGLRIDGDIVSNLGVHAVSQTTLSVAECAKQNYSVFGEHALCNFTAQFLR